MTLYGLMMVRNEVDLLRANLAFHLAAGVDAFLVVDNGSSDGTTRVLEELAADPRVAWTRWDGPYRQSDVATALAREAYFRGADWESPSTPTSSGGRRAATSAPLFATSTPARSRCGWSTSSNAANRPNPRATRCCT